MLVGQQLGPFTIEKELGSGAMGTVYRGIYNKTGERVAIKVMAPGLGTTNDNATQRFEREIEILQQLRHPNIVRYFGQSKRSGMRYFAMEYVEGESLDRVMARRGRMSWEEVVQLGQQLCDALQHAHDKGIVHRDLKPSNLMILKDGTVKLADFGIAKDLDVTALTGANCTVGTAAYMSPEQCRGETADNAMEMFLKHVQEAPVPAAKIVLDVPIWLDTLILGLMEKEPDRRPLNAAKVSQLLGEIQEKVATLQSAGVDAIRARIIDRPRGQRHADDTDKEAARTLSGKKTKRKKKQVPFYRSLWFQAVGLVGLLGAIGLLLWLVFKPEPPEKLFRRAEQLMASKNPDDWIKAREEPIKEFLSRHAGKPDAEEMTAKVRLWANEVDAYQCDQNLLTWLRQHRKGYKIEAHADDEGEVLAWKAVRKEDEGDLADARTFWQETQEKVPGTGWGHLAGKRLVQLDNIAKEEEKLQGMLGQLGKSRQEPKLEGPVRQAFLATRFEAFDDKEMAKIQFDKLKKATSEQTENRFWYLLAAKKVKELEKEKDDWVKDRKKLVGDLLEIARKPDNLKGGFLIGSTIVALYGDNTDLKSDDAKDLKPLVDEARQLAKELADKLGLR